MLSDSAPLTSRQQEILLGILSSFVESAEPIGSKTLARKYVRNLSSATIRSELAELTDMGYLEQPHTSAGRIPTDKAYRFYVGQVKTLPPLPETHVDRIETGYFHVQPLGLDALLEKTSKLLASLSQQASLILLPSVSKTVFSQIRFIKIRPKLAHVVVVAKNGLIQNRPIEMDEDLSQEFLDRIGRYLNEEFEGLTLGEVRDRISVQMVEHKREFDVLYREALKMSQKAFLEPAGSNEEFFVGGTNHLFDQPEFQTDVEKMRALFNAFEEKEKLISILDRFLEAEGVSVSIGAENEIEAMDECALIISSYGDGSQILGTLGVVGPKRMEYPRIMALVDTMASTLSHAIAVKSTL
jgi:heat-inducible transcriptional repressor